MKKHFLTTFTFTTGENRYRDQRIVVARNSDLAYERAKAWFQENYPESELISIVFHEWIT